MLWSLIGSIAPDLDHIYLALINFEQPDHHIYVTHYPLFWLSLLFISFLFLANSKKNGITAVYAVIFSLEGVFHMILDTLSRHIYWLAPFSYKSFCVEDLIGMHAPWFLQKYPWWESGIEAIIVIWALSLFINGRNAGKIRARQKMLS